MRQVTNRLTRLERDLRRAINEVRASCPVCRAMPLVSFEDQSANLWPYGADGVCTRFGRTPPSRGTISLGRLGLTELFASVPFSPDPLFGKLERILLLKAVVARDLRGAENVITRICERHGSGMPLRRQDAQEPAR